MIIILMGVSGAGKSTIGKGLAMKLGWPFYEGDDFHPAENIQKMSQGIPLTEEDRESWGEIVKNKLLSAAKVNENAIFSISALSQAYRKRVFEDIQDLKLIHLKGDFELVFKRLDARKDHYMKNNLLKSQFEALEVPAEALGLDISEPPEILVEKISQFIQPRKTP